MLQGFQRPVSAQFLFPWSISRGFNMKLVRQGLVFIFLLYLSLVYMVGVAHFHSIKFINSACITPYNGYNFKTCAKMRVLIDEHEYDVPQNFTTDLASIPRIVWPIYAPQYTGFVAPAILHDYLYSCHHGLTRQYADEVLYSALIVNGVSAFTASKFFLGVRLFGESHFIESCPWTQ